MVTKFRKFKGGGKLVLALLSVVFLVSVGLGTFEKLTHPENWTDGVAPFPTTSTCQHTLMVIAPTQGHIWADVEEPLGSVIVMQTSADNGACSKVNHVLDQYPDYYGFFAAVTNWHSGTGTAYVASPEYTLPPCPDQ